MKKSIIIFSFLAFFVFIVCACASLNMVEIREIPDVEDWAVAPEGYEVVFKCYMIKNPPTDFDELKTLVETYLDDEFNGYVDNSDSPILYKYFFYRTSKKFPWKWEPDHGYLSEDQIYHHTDDMIVAVYWEPQYEEKEYYVMQKSTSSKDYGATIKSVQY